MYMYRSLVPNNGLPREPHNAASFLRHSQNPMSMVTVTYANTAVAALMQAPGTYTRMHASMQATTHRPLYSTLTQRRWQIFRHSSRCCVRERSRFLPESPGEWSLLLSAICSHETTCKNCTCIYIVHVVYMYMYVLAQTPAGF